VDPPPRRPGTHLRQRARLGRHDDRLGDYLLEPVNYGPPFNRVEINIGRNASFGGGDTYQRDIQIAGLWGYRNTETTRRRHRRDPRQLRDPSRRGRSHLGRRRHRLPPARRLRADARHRPRATRHRPDRRHGLGAGNNDVTLTVANGSRVRGRRDLLIDSERMRVDDIAGNTLIVERAYDGPSSPRTPRRHHLRAAHPHRHPRRARHHRRHPRQRAAPSTCGVPRAWSGSSSRPRPSRSSRRSGRLVPEGVHHRELRGQGVADALKTLRDQTYTEHGRKARLRGCDMPGMEFATPMAAGPAVRRAYRGRDAHLQG
jgi:hypothetical protein